MLGKARICPYLHQAQQCHSFLKCEFFLWKHLKHVDAPTYNDTCKPEKKKNHLCSILQAFNKERRDSFRELLEPVMTDEEMYFHKYELTLMSV